MVSIDPNTLRDFLNKIVNGKYFPEYRSKNPYNWDGDDFASVFKDSMLNHGTMVGKYTSKAFGIPQGVDYYEWILDVDGSGVNGDKNFKKHGSGNSALYDIWEHIRNNYKSYINFRSVNESRNPHLKEVFRLFEEGYLK